MSCGCLFVYTPRLFASLELSNLAFLEFCRALASASTSPKYLPHAGPHVAPEPIRHTFSPSRRCRKVLTTTRQKLLAVPTCSVGTPNDAKKNRYHLQRVIVDRTNYKPTAFTLPGHAILQQFHPRFYYHLAISERQIPRCGLKVASNFLHTVRHR